MCKAIDNISKIQEEALLLSNGLKRDCKAAVTSHPLIMMMFSVNQSMVIRNLMLII